MKIIETDLLTPTDLKPQERDWCYNGLDCCITSEVLSVLLPQLDNVSGSTYAFSKALQGSVLEMRLRGVRVDPQRKAEVIEQYYTKLDVLERNLERIVREGLGFYGFNFKSNADKIKLFYEYLYIPVIKKGGKPTADRDALEKMNAYMIARPVVSHLLFLVDLAKKIS